MSQAVSLLLLLLISILCLVYFKNDTFHHNYPAFKEACDKDLFNPSIKTSLLILELNNPTTNSIVLNKILRTFSFLLDPNFIKAKIGFLNGKLSK